VQYSTAQSAPPFDASPTDGATRDGGASADADAEAAVALATVPPRPGTEDGDGEQSFVFALQSLVVNPGPDAGQEPRGYDMDGVATCPGPPSCILDDAAPACDGPGGRDNAALDVVRSVGIDLDGRTAVNFAEGYSGVLVTVRGYNGGKNDRQVTVSLYNEARSQGTIDGGTGPDPDGGFVRPRYDGTDYWRVDLGGLATGPAEGTPCTMDTCVAVVRDTAAYVNDGILVASLDIPIPVQGSRVDLRGGRLTARIVGTGADMRLEDGVLQGRMLVRDILASLVDPFVGTTRLCNNPASAALIKPVLCKARDLAADFNKDRASAPCGALSLVALFSAPQARMGTATTGDGGSQAPCPEESIRCD
jgi:hypothetical protein